jgi:hypothetical protein
VSPLLKKLKTDLPEDPAILLGIYQKEYVSRYNKDTYAHNVFAELFTTAKLWK